jgi:hypothetical protein
MIVLTTKATVLIVAIMATLSIVAAATATIMTSLTQQAHAASSQTFCYNSLSTIGGRNCFNNPHDCHTAQASDNTATSRCHKG